MALLFAILFSFCPSWAFPSMKEDYEDFLIGMLKNPRAYLENSDHQEKIVTFIQWGFNTEALTEYARKNPKEAMALAASTKNDYLWFSLLSASHPKHKNLLSYFLTEDLTKQAPPRQLVATGLLRQEDKKLDEALSLFVNAAEGGFYGAYLLAEAVCCEMEDFVQRKHFQKLASSHGWAITDLDLAEEEPNQEKAMQILEEVANKGCAEAFSKLADIYEQKGDTNKAIHLHFHALDLGYDDDLGSLFSMALMEHREPQPYPQEHIYQKIHDFYQARAQKGLYTDYLHLFDKIFFHPHSPLRNPESAQNVLRQYDDAQGQPKNNPESLLRWGEYYFETGDHKKALTCFHTLSDLENSLDMDSHTLAKVFKYLSNIYEKASDWNNWEKYMFKGIMVGTSPMEFSFPNDKEETKLTALRHFLKGLPDHQSFMFHPYTIDWVLNVLETMDLSCLYGVVFFQKQAFAMGFDLPQTLNEKIARLMPSQKNYVGTELDKANLGTYKENTHLIVSALGEVLGKINLAGQMKSLPELTEQTAGKLDGKMSNRGRDD